MGRERKAGPPRGGKLVEPDRLRFGLSGERFAEDALLGFFDIKKSSRLFQYRFCFDLFRPGLSLLQGRFQGSDSSLSRLILSDEAGRQPVDELGYRSVVSGH